MEVTDDTTVFELRQTVSSVTGRARIVAVYDESSEEKLHDTLSVREAGLSTSSILIVVEETGSHVVVSQCLGCHCSDSEFDELCVAVGFSVETLDLHSCYALTIGSLASLQHLKRPTVRARDS